MVLAAALASAKTDAISLIDKNAQILNDLLEIINAL
jgi:hypothetical protein